MSRLWTNPPLKPDGTLDYAQLTLAEIAEDLTESLVDRVFNSGVEELQPLLDDVPEYDEFAVDAKPSAALIAVMESLLALEATDVDYRSVDTQKVLQQAVTELRAKVG